MQIQTKQNQNKTNQSNQKKHFFFKTRKKKYSEKFQQV